MGTDNLQEIRQVSEVNSKVKLVVKHHLPNIFEKGIERRARIAALCDKKVPSVNGDWD